jgi:hypothetical protein
LQDSSQIDATSPTHWVSQLPMQQNESTLQIAVAHASHDAASLTPVEQTECAQLPPPQVW